MYINVVDMNVENVDPSEVFEALYELRVIRILAMIFAIFSSFVIVAVSGFIIWFDLMGSNYGKNLINSLTRALCWDNIFLICGTVPIDLILALVGPLGNDYLCHLQIMAKNILVTQYALLIGAISVVKYWYIFVLKNPVGQYDDFWSFYLNVMFVILTTISQFAFQAFPGKNSYMFYICSGRFPEQSFQKVNFPAHLTIVGSMGVYIFVQRKIKYFQKNNPIAAWKLESNPVISVKSTLADFSTLIVGFIVLIPTIVITNSLNKVPFPQLTKPFFMLMIDFHFFVMPSTCMAIALFVYFSKHEKLTKSMYDETKFVITKIWQFIRRKEPHSLIN